MTNEVNNSYNTGPNEGPPREYYKKISKEMVAAIDKAVGIPAGLLGAIGWYLFRTDHFATAGVSCIIIGLILGSYIAYMHLAHNVRDAPSIELWPIVTCAIISTISATVAIMNFLLYWGAIQVFTDGNSLKPKPIDPTRIYQNGVPIASYSIEQYQAIENIYVFFDVKLSTDVDMMDTFQFRDWNLLCQSGQFKGEVDNKYADGKTFTCKVEV
jgi:hypothetical protein